MEGRQVEAGLPQRPPEIQRLRRGKTVMFCIVPGTHKSKIMHVPKGVHPVPPPPLDGHFPIIVKQQARDMSIRRLHPIEICGFVLVPERRVFF